MLRTYKDTTSNKFYEADLDTVDSKTKTLFVRDLQTNKEIVISVSTLKMYWTDVNDIYSKT